MGRWTLMCFCISVLISASAQRDCTDLRGQVVSHGIHYVPGPETCTLCVCDNGVPLQCKAVLCSPPQDCRSFRVGATCCEFICLDDVVKPADTAESNVRVAAGGAAAVVLATVLLVVYRVRKQKRRRATHADDQRSLTSIGYISGSMAYMSSTCETALGGWKPPGNYLPRGEAPPPYDEVVAQCRAENARMMSESAYHRSYPASVETMARPDDMSCVSHGYVNMPRPLQQVLTIQIANPQNCYNAPLLQSVHPGEVRDLNHMTHYPLAPSMGGLPHRARLTGSLGAISGRVSVPREPDHERPHNVPGFYTHVHTALHRTIPRISTAIEALELGAFRRTESGAPCGGEVRRSFHRPCAAARRDTGRSVPRHLDLASTADSHISQSSLRLSHGSSRSRAQSTDNVGGSPAGQALPPAAAPAPPPCKPEPQPAAPAPAPAPAPPHATLPLTVDKPSCECSYAACGAESGAPGGDTGDEHDDYRSECENCKSANSSRWVLEEGWGDEAEEGGTQTLQRRAPVAALPAPATATLPQPVTKPRTGMGPPSNWENWFNTIPDSDTESEEE